MFHRAYGLSRWVLADGKTVTSLSAPNWGNFSYWMRQLSSVDGIVVSPELMTVAGFSPREVLGVRELVEKRIAQVIRFSQALPHTLFVLGTSSYGVEGTTPKNSALFIQDGVVVGSTHKRSAPTEEEREYFDLPSQEPPALINESIGVVICADLGTATVFGSRFSPSRTDAVLALVGRDYLMGVDVSIIHPNAQTLIVLTCWSVGGNVVGIRKFGAEWFYGIQLENIVKGIFKVYPRIEEIVVVDRVPNLGDSTLVPQAPFNACFTRS